MTKLLFINKGSLKCIFIALLFLFGCSPTEPEDIYGCTDDTACNYNANATDDDGNCYFAEDWEDMCGVCDLVPSNDCTQDEWGECGLDLSQDSSPHNVCQTMLVNGSSEIFINGYYDGNEEIDMIKLKYWVTGAFEDEDTYMGDMNNDGSLNIYDVLLLVGIILDGDSGDIFDVMEIIKRV